MSGKYLKYLFRPNFTALLISFGIMLTVSLFTLMFSQVPFVLGFGRAVSTVFNYFVALYPVIVYYRSLYGREALLINQIGLPTSHLFHTHIVFAVIIGLAGQIVTFPIIWENLHNFALGLDIAVNEPGSEQFVSELNQYVEKFIRTYYDTPLRIILAFLMSVISQVGFLLYAGAVIAFAHRRASTKHRVWAGLGGAILLGVLFVVAIAVLGLGIGILFLSGKFQLMDLAEEAIPSAAIIADLLMKWFSYLMVGVTLFMTLMTILLYFYTKKKVVKERNLF